MTIVVLRLQGLNTEAGSEDIRRFFHGLHIPEGGVHIIGGKMGEAFIIFNSEREGQLAMRYSGKLLRGSSVSLHISSLAELKRKMESRLKKPKSTAVETKTVPSSPPDNNRGLLLSLMTAIQGLHSNEKVDQGQVPENFNQNVPENDKWSSTDNQTIKDAPHSLTHDMAPKEQKSSGENLNSCKPGYLRLYGFPDSVSKEEIYQFLLGLPVLEVITKVRLSLGWCCLVKLASFTDAEEGLKYSHRKFKEYHVEVRLAHEKMWTDAVEQSKNFMQNIKPHTFSERREVNTERNAIRGFSTKRSAEESLSRGPPKKYSRNFTSPQTELCVIVNNLSKNITKTEIKDIFGCHAIPNYRIKHLLNKWRERTSTAFITFEHAEDYASALNMNGTNVGLKDIEVSAITKEEMLAILRKNRCANVWRPPLHGNPHSDMSCVYARNFPADVRKVEVRDFFRRFNVCEDAIILLVDSQGSGVGEAIVQFECEDIAKQAQSFHGKYFMGAKILLTCITHQQREKILGTL
ncbi:RNA-binding protein 12B [Carassius gibelio]|uniref:RNA-binding protein 12B n=1 Tax=Carassius gibelio TaxID=101364 RepID=UPI00227901D7|nr:RNA-binding protein 12B [Carassius gibelio]